jgi:hypothetical protein
MPKYISKEIIEKIKILRSQGWSLNEIYHEVRVGYGSVSRYIQGVKILPQYQQIWLNKRNGSKAIMDRHKKIANQKAEDFIVNLTEKEKLLFIAALYWGEGGKKDFNFTNSDSEMIKIFVRCLREILKIDQKDIRASIRIYEDLDRNICLNHWSKITNIPIEEFVNVDVLKGKKLGKLAFGLCRIRIKKGGDMLKYLLALNKRVSKIF